MNKVKISVYNTYGKRSGDELDYYYIMFDTPENRKKVLDELHRYCNIIDNTDDFISGETNSIAYLYEDGDWDDPTFGHIIVETEAELIGKLELQLAQIKKEFEELK